VKGEILSPVPTSGIVDLAVGLIFVFAVTAALSSAITELIARFLGLRGAYLLSGLRELVDDDQVTTDLSEAESAYRAVQAMMRGDPAPAQMPSMTSAVLGSPILSSQGMPGRITSRNIVLRPAQGIMGQLPRMTASGTAANVWRQRRSLPSYIPATSFAEAVVDLIVPGAAGTTTMTAVQDNLNKLPAAMPFRQSLQALAKDAGDDITRFRSDVERWYDDHMDRVSGWYKRHVAKITLAVGAVLVVLLNINALTIGRILYTESSVSSAVSIVAAKGTSCSASQAQQACLSSLEAQLSAAAAAGLPIGWGTVRDCTPPGAKCNWLDQRGLFSRHGNSAWQLIVVLIGFAIMVISLLPGAQFWFGLLTRLGGLRASGPKPAAT
jgi:hypothetical protein